MGSGERAAMCFHGVKKGFVFNSSSGFGLLPWISPQMAKNEYVGKDVPSPVTCKVLCKAKMRCGDIDLKGQ